MASNSFRSIPLSLECIVLCFDNQQLNVLAENNPHKVYKGKLSLPTGAIKENDPLEKSVKKTLSLVPGLKVNGMEQLGYSADPKRFPKKRVISLSQVIYAHPSSLQYEQGAEYKWLPVQKVPALALDHKEQVKEALKRLQEKSLTGSVIFQLLPEKFTLTQVQAVYEAIWNKVLDKRNFRKKLLSLGIVKSLRQYEKGVAHKAAQYYALDQRNFNSFIANGGILTF